MSGQQHQARSRSSPKQGPLRATMPLASLTKEGSILRDAYDPKGNPSGGARTRSAEGQIDQRSPSNEEGGKMRSSSGSIRRTASLDAMYLKGLFPREGAAVGLDKTTQTDPAGNIDPLHLRISTESVEDKLNKLMIRPRRNSETSISDQGAAEEGTVNASSQTCTFISSSSPEQRRRILGRDETAIASHHPRLSKSTSPQSKNVRSSRSSDDGVIKSISPNSKNFTGSSTSGPKSVSRSSEEGLNQEIENLILRPLVDPNTVRMPTPEGRKAPVADLYRIANRPSPTMQSMMMGGGQQSSEDSQNSSPDQERMMMISSSGGGSSPHLIINRFSSRAPPDGCEDTSNASSATHLAKSSMGAAIIRPIPKLLTQPQYFTLTASESGGSPLQRDIAGGRDAAAAKKETGVGDTSSGSVSSVVSEQHQQTEKMIVSCSSSTSVCKEDDLLPKVPDIDKDALE